MRMCENSMSTVGAASWCDRATTVLLAYLTPSALGVRGRKPLLRLNIGTSRVFTRPLMRRSPFAAAGLNAIKRSWFLLAASALCGLSACDSTSSTNPSTSTTEVSPQTSTAAPALFSEVAEESGLDFQHYSGATGRFHLPEILGSGLALIDYDSDGDLDVFFVQSNDYFADYASNEAVLFPLPESQPVGHRLFANQLVPTGTLSFSDVTEAAGLAEVSYGMGAAVADYDNDGDPDIYVSSFGDNAFYRNDNGVFSRLQGASGAQDLRWSASASFCDVNNDSWLDLYVTNYLRYSRDDQIVCRDSLGQQDYCGPQSYSGVTDALFINTGEGGFIDRSSEWGVNTVSSTGLGVVCRDLNQDGTADVYVANDAEPNLLWSNRNNERFEEQGQLMGAAFNVNGMDEGSMGIAAGDYDRDGDDDLFITHVSNETNTLYRNDLKLGFIDMTNQANLATPSLSRTGFGTEWLDIDNDTDLDVLIVNGAVQRFVDKRGNLSDNYGQKNQVFMNNGAGRFIDAGASADAATQLKLTGRGAAFGDIDNDGDTDVVVSNNDGPARLYLNDVGQDSAWLGVKLEGTTSARDAFGAVVNLTLPSGVVLRRVVRSDGSYLSASDQRVLFGLADASSPQTVTVRWPSGHIQEFPGLSLNTYHVLVENE